MATITKRQFEEYKQFCRDRENGRLLTKDGLRLVCEGLNRDPEAIGKHFLEVLSRMENKD